jgi:hypothetical protein
VSDRLFDMEEYPEVPILRPPRRRKSEGDARFRGCLAPGTPVLMADFSWRGVEQLKVGDEIVAFDEDCEPGLGKQRRLALAVVERRKVLSLASCRIETDTAPPVVASDGHLWLVRAAQRKGTGWKRTAWRTTAELSVGDEILRFGPDGSPEVGYLAGILDGEGCLSGRRLSFSQRPGPVLERAKVALAAVGATMTEERGRADGAVEVRVGGGVASTMSVLGQVPTSRFRASRFWLGRQITSKNGSLPVVATVTAKADVGEQPVVALQTSTGTLIAAGLYSHNSYPPEWDCCTTCRGTGSPSRFVGTRPDGAEEWITGEECCPDCLGMGSLKARVRLEAGHRCLRCQHPYIPANDGRMLELTPSGYIVCGTCEGDGMVTAIVGGLAVDSVEEGEEIAVDLATLRPGGDLTDGVGKKKCPTCKGRGLLWNDGWSPCDERCDHRGPFRVLDDGQWREGSEYEGLVTLIPGVERITSITEVQAAWRILTVHHADGNKANIRWWNLLSLCQRCHLEIQAKVVMERVYPHEHSEWFKPFVAGYYAFVYLDEELTRPEVEERLDELLDLERVA